MAADRIKMECDTVTWDGNGKELTRVTSVDTLLLEESEQPENYKSNIIAAIAKVLTQDRDAGTGGGDTSAIATSMRAIDLTLCPTTFQETYVLHIRAWERNDSTAIADTFNKVISVALGLGVDISQFNTPVELPKSAFSGRSKNDSPSQPKANLLPEGAGKADADAPTNFVTTNSGLKFRVLRKGTGHKPVATDRVKVQYHGWLNGGRVFDSTYERGSPEEFPLNRVIDGLTEGLQLIGEGGMIELEVPSNLGYGDKGNSPKIPPKAKLHFLVELLNVG